MASFALDYDPEAWLRVPVEFPDGADVSAEAWAARQAVTQRGRGFFETRASGSLDQYFLDVVAAARGAGRHESFWALIADDAPAFIAVTVDALAVDGPLDDFLGALVAQRAGEYEPATHTPVQAAGLGEGVHVLRTDIDERGGVYRSLYYVFRVGDTDYVIATQTYDTAALAWAVPRIVDFIDGIRPGTVLG